MKAQSAIFLHIQEPMKVAGMPPLHAILVLIGELVLASAVGLFAGNGVAFALVLVTLPPAIAWIIVLRRREPHCETLLLHPASFYQARKMRQLVSGFPLKTPKRRTR
ncbi:hypothetical protein [Labrenzia sp. THAF82]|uniref:hypothetical protein n=1 Tax=Labrenzia sp. THAF82 TaxID=2587861 RepID=UPI001268BE22|nr:hypothetical protein [Labrenzia sp. THAF82]